MIQDIAPHQLRIEFCDCSPQQKDLVLACFEGKVMLRDKEELSFPCCECFPKEQWTTMAYLFSVDETRFFRYVFSKEEAMAY